MAKPVCSRNHVPSTLMRLALSAEMPMPIRNIDAICIVNESSVKQRRKPPATEIAVQTVTTFLEPMRSPRAPNGIEKKTAVSMGTRNSIEKPTVSMLSIGMTSTASAET